MSSGEWAASTGSSPATNDDPVRIGILCAARIAPLAIVSPARATGARLVAVAARNPARAAEFADEHGVERVVDSYDALLADPEVEVVYNPLPNGLHGPWNTAALRAGKHVLSEKPFAVDAGEARDVVAAARSAGRHVLEGFHYPFHPLYRRIVELVTDGAIGQVRHVEAPMRMPTPGPEDPRWDLALAGGSTMDLGCYAFHVGRHLGRAFGGGEPVVERAVAAEHPDHPGVDEWLSVEARYPTGATATLGSDMNSGQVWDFHLTVVGTRGSLRAGEFLRPHVDDSLLLRRDGHDDVVEHLADRASYTYQLEAFTALVRDGRALPYDPLEDAIAQASFVESAYRAAGLEPRPRSTID